MKNFIFSARANTTTTQFVELPVPTGTVTGRLYIKPKNGAEALVSGGVASVVSNGVNLSIPASYATSAQFPATFRLQLSVNGGAWKDYAVGRGVLSGETGTREKQFHAQPDAVVGALAAVGNTFAINMEGYAAATFYFTGTFAGVNVVFEQSPDSTNGVDGTWFLAIGASISSNTATTTITTLATNSGWDVSAPGSTWVRVRMTGITSGTVNCKGVSSTAAIESAPVIATHGITLQSASTSNSVSTASTNTANIRNAAINLVELTVSNPTATPAFLKVYNKASTPTLASDTPVITIPIPANSFTPVQFGALGKRFSSGLSIAITGAAAANDTTNAPAGIQTSMSYT